MNANDLRQLSPDQLLSHLARQVQIGLDIVNAGQLVVDPPKNDLVTRPLLILGDFVIYPRFFTQYQPPAGPTPAAPESGPGIQTGQQSGNGLQIEPTEPPSSGNLEPVPPLHSSPADFTLCPKCGEKHPTTPYR